MRVIIKKFHYLFLLHAKLLFYIYFVSMNFKILQSISGFLHSAGNLFITRHCVVCGRELLQFEKQFCMECAAEMPLTYFWIFKNNPAEIIFWGRTRIERVFPLMFFRNDYKRCVYNVKYKGNIPLGLYLGKMLGKKIRACPDKLDTIDYIIPVPLHWRKKIKRGFNQAEIIARGIAAGYAAERTTACVSGICERRKTQVLTNILKRRRFTKTQTQKDRLSRWRNVEDAFKISNHALSRELRSKNQIHFLLVDDVLTTGATLEACAGILTKACGGAGKQCKVSIATLAYVE